MTGTSLPLLHRVGPAWLIVTLLYGTHTLGHLILKKSTSISNINMTELGQEAKLTKEKQDILNMAKSHAEFPKYPNLQEEEVLKEYNKLRLKSPGSSIFTSGFQFLFIDTTEDESSLAFRDATPSMSLMKNLEYNALLDPDSGIIVKGQPKDVADKDQVGKYHIMTGMIDGMAITHEHHHQVVTKIRLQKKNLGPPSLTDYGARIATTTTTTTTTKKCHDHYDNTKKLGMSTEAQPEVFVIFDYANTLRFNKNNTSIVDYLSVYFHGVNNRYATVSEPKITFKISGVMAVSSRKAQPFLEKHKLRGGGYDINLVLGSFAGWIYENLRQLPKHDVAHLITAEIMKTKDAKGMYIDSISGLAFLKGACWISSEIKKSLATSIAQDIDGIWDGVFTSAHELAHNLGASHDGFGVANGCPSTDGFIMSYAGWGTKNKFFFSKCSIKAITEFILSSAASCILRNEYPSLMSPYQVDNTGERLDMTMLCKTYTKNINAYVDPDISPSDLCKNLICRYPDDMNGYHLVKVNHPPGDNASCNHFKGRCQNGDCILNGV